MAVEPEIGGVLATGATDVAQVIAATSGVLVAGLVAVMPFARRPRLEVREDPLRIQSRVEQSSRGGLPYVRLMAHNSKRRRAATATRVLVEGYRRQGRSRTEEVPLGHPPLAWTSAGGADESTIFSGGERPFDFGMFLRVRTAAGGRVMYPTAEGGGLDIPHYAGAPDGEWRLWLGLAVPAPNDERHLLPPVENGYVIRLIIGASDGAARGFEVDINWADGADAPDEVLRSALEHLAVRQP